MTDDDGKIYYIPAEHYPSGYSYDDDHRQLRFKDVVVASRDHNHEWRVQIYDPAARAAFKLDHMAAVQRYNLWRKKDEAEYRARVRRNIELQAASERRAFGVGGTP